MFMCAVRGYVRVMTIRTIVAALAVPLVLAATASAADVVPKPGATLSGSIKFPRRQEMRIESDPADGSKILVRMGFDGKCKGGGIGEAWVSTLETKPTVRVRNGRFSAKVKGTEIDFGSVKGRTATFTWKLSGRFSASDSATATVSGTATITNARREVISRCAIAKPASVRLAVR
jgi:opacity protein-like surface antigen